MKRYLVTGGAGFIGSALCHLLLSDAETEVVAIDRMTYAANPATLKALEAHDTSAMLLRMCAMRRPCAMR
jgi:dTDP-glucose 4,6-dehydratase